MVNALSKNFCCNLNENRSHIKHPENIKEDNFIPNAIVPCDDQYICSATERARAIIDVIIGNINDPLYGCFEKYIPKKKKAIHTGNGPAYTSNGMARFLILRRYVINNILIDDIRVVKISPSELLICVNNGDRM